MIARLTLTETIGLLGTGPKFDLCSGVDQGVPRLDIPPVSTLIEVTGAVSARCYVDDMGVSFCPTVFPSPLSVAASFVCLDIQLFVDKNAS